MLYSGYQSHYFHFNFEALVPRVVMVVLAALSWG